MDYLDILEIIRSVKPPASQERIPWVDEVKMKRGYWWRAVIERVYPILIDQLYLQRLGNTKKNNKLRIQARKNPTGNPRSSTKSPKLPNVRLLRLRARGEDPSKN